MNVEPMPPVTECHTIRKPEQLPEWFVQLGLPQPRVLMLESAQLTYAEFVRLQRIFGSAQITDASQPLSWLRMIKTPWEIGQMRLSAQLARRLASTSSKVGNLAFLDVTGRIAQTLVNLAHQPEAMTHPDGMQIKITRQEIGQIVGCSRETVGRILKMMEEDHLISAHGKTIVVYGTR